MSMSTLKIIQFIQIFICYSAVTVLLPFLVLKNKFKHEPVSKQFLMYYTAGNFYIINIVFLVQLLHISNFFTLLLFTCILPLLYWSRVNAVSLKNKVNSIIIHQKKMMLGHLGWKTVLFNNLKAFHVWFIKVCKVLYHKIIEKPFQWILIGIISFALLWIYGRQIYFVYGYCASDIPVHMDWINQMSRGALFARGVYPFGFHCMMYYLHTVFHFDVYVLMSTFYFVQCIYVHVVLLATLKGLCKTKYLPYLGVLLYLLPDIWATQTYSRFAATLPQEFGMIFVMPSIYFLIEFFKTKKDELKSVHNKWICIGFAMAFSLTLAIHFYGTMIAGLCCIGIAFGFFHRFVQKEYFKKIMFTGILSVFTAVLPMAIAYATGTPLQGSLGWGMSVINGTSNKTSQSSSEKKSKDKDGNTVIKNGNTTTVIINNNNQNQTSSQSSNTSSSSSSAKAKVEKTSIFDKFKNLYKSILNIYKDFIINSKYIKYGMKLSKGIFYSFVICFVMGVIRFLFKDIHYGCTYMSISFCMGILTILLCSNLFHIPALMDKTRCSIYFVYVYVLCLTLMLDSILYVFTFPNILLYVRNLLSLVVCLGVVLTLYQHDFIKQRKYSSDFVTNGAYTCLTNIIHDNKDYTWTIVSCNDETQMGLDHGWHYETISFLRQMRNMNAKTKIIILTNTVYFFIEKIPLNYTIQYEESGQNVSRIGAAQPVPNQGGISIYEGQSRWIVMSKMYYWVQAFKEKYPNDIVKYYEDDQFICYKMEQNPYHLTNFAIDYGYNQ